MAAFFTRFLDKVRGYDIDEEYEDYEDVENEEDSSEEIDVAQDMRAGLFRRQSKVVDFARTSHAGQQVVIIQPSSIETAQEVCNHLRGGRTVICNFEKVDQKIAQRVMDFVTGATYAIDGQVHKVSPMIFVTVPRNVSLMDENHPIGMEYMSAREMYAAKYLISAVKMSNVCILERHHFRWCFFYSIIIPGVSTINNGEQL